MLSCAYIGEMVVTSELATITPLEPSVIASLLISVAVTVSSKGKVILEVRRLHRNNQRLCFKNFSISIL